MNDINSVLKKEIELIKPPKEVYYDINRVSENFCRKLKKDLKKKKIKADVFIGGSLAKNTIVKKDKYDVDVFVRFENNKEDISKLLGKVLGKKAKKIHGSRDYYQLVEKNIIIEAIPVLKIKKPEKALNVTDLSYFHVNYIVKKIKKIKKLADEIRLAKTFAHAQNCYGAESYILGFSGYALELLVCHYKNFLKFIRAIAESNIDKKNKITIDDNNFYKKKKDILVELNESKLQSPIILIDPTFKERNALAGLSYRTFNKFKKACTNFLKKPNHESFKTKDIKEILMRKYKDKLKIISLKTNKQAGDIAGTKSRKFFGFFIRKLKREFNQKNYFDYDEKNNIAYLYFTINKKKPEIIKGPPVTSVYNLTGFKKAHKNAFIKNHFAYAKIKHDLSFEKWFNNFLKKNRKIIKEMSVKEIKAIK